MQDHFFPTNNGSKGTGSLGRFESAVVVALAEGLHSVPELIP